jgi:hypothetical protein
MIRSLMVRLHIMRTNKAPLLLRPIRSPAIPPMAILPSVPLIPSSPRPRALRACSIALPGAEIPSGGMICAVASYLLVIKKAKSALATREHNATRKRSRRCFQIKRTLATVFLGNADGVGTPLNRFGGSSSGGKWTVRPLSSLTLHLVDTGREGCEKGVPLQPADISGADISGTDLRFLLMNFVASLSQVYPYPVKKE